MEEVGKIAFQTQRVYKINDFYQRLMNSRKNDMGLIAKMYHLRNSLVLLAAMTVNVAAAEPDLWVSVDRVARHTCPSNECGVAGQLMFRERVEVLETKGDWVRISKLYSASCSGGTSEYVKSGNSTCVSSNGIKNGMFAEWVSSKSLTKVRPADPGEGAIGDDNLVKNSDDYRLYRAQFAKAARDLIDNGTCTAGDFEEVGGWMSSPTKGQGMYFMYCGGMTKANRLYLDVRSGDVSH